MVWDHEFDVNGVQQLVAFVVGLAILAGSALYLFIAQKKSWDDNVSFGEPPFAHFLFHSSGSAPIWLGIRLYLGFEWLSAGWHKLDDDAWRSGEALAGFWQGAAAIPTTEQAEQGARARINYDGWREFIQYMLDNEWFEWFNWIIILGEITVGVGLIAGAFTGVAAFFGATLNVSFLLSGTTSSNPVLLILAILVIVGWRVAGYIGLDRILMPMVGTPWQRNVGGSSKSSIEGNDQATPARPAQS